MMRKIVMKLGKIAVFLFGCLILPTAAVAADVKAGEKVFRQCKACHMVKKDNHRVGPSLVNVFGRVAGTAEGFKKYSKAMKNSGITWNEETIAAYMKDPKGYIKGNKMAFRGLKKDADIDNLLAYLKQFSQ
jgi:cytochrome c